MVEADVFDAVRRGYDQLEPASTAEIVDYFSTVDKESIAGHVSHIKGILFEQEYVDLLAIQGIDAEIFEATNHPDTDIAILEGGDVVTELQLKATESVCYVGAAIEENPDIDFVVTSEVAADIDGEFVIDSGIEEAALEQAVGDALFDDVVNPINPLSMIGWLLGLPF